MNMEMNSTNAKMTTSISKHIVMVPFLAQGHLIPFLALAKHIHKRTGFTVTIATTPLNVKHLQKAILSDPHSKNISSIHLAELPFSSSDYGLPPNTENTQALNFTQIGLFLTATTFLKTPLQNIVEKITFEDGTPPLCIISDPFLSWANEVAKLCHTVNYSFNTGGAYGTAIFITLYQNLPNRMLRSGQEEFSLQGFPQSVKLHVSQLSQSFLEADGTDVLSRFFQSQIALTIKSEGWLCHTAEDVEKSGIEMLRSILKLPVWSIGPLLPVSMLSNDSNITNGIGMHECISWLNSKPKKSVLYISFGSETRINRAQMMALAQGLEQSSVSFIWVIRPPVEFERNADFRPEWLPQGFEFQVTQSKKGLLVHQWAPQLEILAHNSTGAFLSHCGWNSVMEGLSQGLPIISWPLASEQFYTSKMLVEEMQVAVEICRGFNGVVTGEAIKGVVEMVMNGEGGKNMRRNAEETGNKLKAAMREEKGNEGSSIKALDHFLADVISKRSA